MEVLEYLYPLQNLHFKLERLWKRVASLGRSLESLSYALLSISPAYVRNRVRADLFMLSMYLH